MNNKGYLYIDLIASIFLISIITILISLSLNNYINSLKVYKKTIETTYYIEFLANKSLAPNNSGREILDIDNNYYYEIKLINACEYYDEYKISLYDIGGLVIEMEKIKLK